MMHDFAGLSFVNLSSCLRHRPIGSGVLRVLGVGLAADPSHQNAPVNTGTVVNSKIVMLNSGNGQCA